MMKISIVTPVFNEQKGLSRYFSAIKNLNYNLKDFELVVVDDCSSDDSLKLLEEFAAETEINFRIIRSKTNCGRSVARLTGAKAAKYKNLLFLDAKCEVFPDVLKVIDDIKYFPINPCVVQRRDNVFDLFFYILRRAYYRNNFGVNSRKCFICRDNFDAMAKGTTMFFCDKELFIASQPSNISNKNNSDDTALLWNIVQKKDILFAPKVRCYYNTRSTFAANFFHIFNRGPKFVDYYYKPSKKHFWLINLLIIFSTLLIYRIFNGEIFVSGALFVLFILDIILAIGVARTSREFLVFLLLFPVFVLVFMVGLIKGIFIKIFNFAKK